MESIDKSLEEYIVIKALESGVNVIGMTRGKDTRLQHTEKLTKGDVLVAQFTDNISAIKISGKAQIMTKHGQVESGE
ncbi:MAG: trp RNA-binding attenuation protein MtrB [Christensenellaceae bacterium]